MAGARIRKRVTALGKRSRGGRIPRELRDEIAEYARARRTEGIGMREIAAEVGVSPESIRRWTAAGWGETAKALPVRVRAEEVDDEGGIVVVTPGGVRIEGLDVAQAAELAHRLG